MPIDPRLTEVKERETAIAKLFDYSNNHPIIASYIKSWQAGYFLCFEQMLINLVLNLADTNKFLKNEFTKQLNTRASATIVTIPPKEEE